MEPKHLEFLQTYCSDCHGADEPKGQVRLDDIPLEIADIPTAERWQKVLGVLNSGDMPPADSEQPPDVQKAWFLEVLSRQMVIARKALADTGGAITMRRLNRREYVNTIRELLGVEINPRDLPADDDGGTFDTIGSALFFSSDQFEQYRKLGRAALDEAISMGERPVKQVQRYEVEESVNQNVRRDYESALGTLRKVVEWRKSGKPPGDFGFNDESDATTNEGLARGRETAALAYLRDPATLTGAFPKLGLETVTIPHTAAPGKYIIRVRAGFPPDAPHCSTINMTPLLRPKPGTAEGAIQRFIELGTQGDEGWPAEMKLLGCRRVKGMIESPEIIEFPVTVTKTGSRLFGLRERRCNGDAEVSGLLNFYWFYKADDHKKHQFGFWRSLWIDWIEWEGPFVEQWPPQSHALVFGRLDVTATPSDEHARQVIEQFAERAFRGRPVNPAYLDRLLGHFAEQRAAGSPFVEAIKEPLSLVLASPSFLYVAEPVERGAVAAPASTQRVSLPDAELANRLSYFLWSSPPDEG